MARNVIWECERYNEANDKLGQVQREYNLAERELTQFKRTANFEY